MKFSLSMDLNALHGSKYPILATSGVQPQSMAPDAWVEVFIRYRWDFPKVLCCNISPTEGDGKTPIGFIIRTELSQCQLCLNILL